MRIVAAAYVTTICCYNHEISYSTHTFVNTHTHPNNHSCSCVRLHFSSRTMRWVLGTLCVPCTYYCNLIYFYRGFGWWIHINCRVARHKYCRKWGKKGIGNRWCSPQSVCDMSLWSFGYNNSFQLKETRNTISLVSPFHELNKWRKKTKRKKKQNRLAKLYHLHTTYIEHIYICEHHVDTQYKRQRHSGLYEHATASKCVRSRIIRFTNTNGETSFTIPSQK